MFSKILNFFQKSPEQQRENFEELIQENTKVLDEEEQYLLTNILKLRDISARDIMVPRAEIKGLSVDLNFDEFARSFADSPFTRMPIYRKNLDQIVGFLHAKDVCHYATSPKNFRLQEKIRKVLFISPSMGVMDLLTQMRTTQIPVAIVVDEYGGTDGMITSWDVIREILGDLAEFQSHEGRPELNHVSENQYLADSRYPIEDFEAQFGPFLSSEEREEDIETLGGLIMHTAGRVPARHEIIRHPGGVTFEILDADQRRIKQVRLWVLYKKSERDKED